MYNISNELKIPFPWEKRRPVLLERCLYIPGFYNRHEEWRILPWSEECFFGNDHPICIEYCSGNGQWIAERAKQFPSFNWVAVEKRFDRARKIWARIFREGLSNLFVACGEGLTFTRYYAPASSAQEIFVNFPDPWPKLRHAKHRLVRAEFLQELSRIGKKGARATFVTDDAAYALQMLKELALCPEWRPRLSAPHFSTQWPDYGPSFFAELWKSKGRSIHYLPYQLL